MHFLFYFERNLLPKCVITSTQPPFWSQNYVIFSNYTHAPSNRCECVITLLPWTTNISRSHLLYKFMHFIIIVWTVRIIHSSPSAPSAAALSGMLSLFQRRTHKHVAWMASFIHPFRPYVSLVSFRVSLRSIPSIVSLFNQQQHVRIIFTFIPAVLIITAVYFFFVGKKNVAE